MTEDRGQWTVNDGSVKDGEFLEQAPGKTGDEACAWGLGPRPSHHVLDIDVQLSEGW